MALGAAATFLGLNGYLLVAATGELAELVLAVVTGRTRDLIDISSWLQTHSRPITV